MDGTGYLQYTNTTVMKIHTALSGPLTAWILCMMHMQARSQDSLFYTNGSVIVGQVEEIGLDQIRYRTKSDNNQVIVVVDKWDLASVNLKGGQVYEFAGTNKDGPFGPTFIDRKHALFLDLVAPALDHLTVGYEQVLGRRVNLTAKAG